MPVAATSPPPRRRGASRLLLVAACLWTAAPASAQPSLDGLVSRDAADEVTVRAVRLDAPLDLDGRLDDAVYARVAPITDFIQQEPQEGQPATEKTEAWILFDESNLVHRHAVLGQPARAGDRQRAAPRQRQHPRQRERDLRHRHLPRPAQRLPVPDQPARRAARHDGDRRPAELGVERHLVREDRPLRAGLDDGGGDPVQDAALPRQRPADLGHQPPPAGEVEERVLLPLAGTGRARHRRREPDGVGGHAHRGRDAGRVEEPRAEAVRGLVGDHHAHQRWTRRRRAGQCRVRLQVRAHARTDPRRHRAYRLRPGRGRPAADQPHPLQPVLSREARLLHRRPGHLRLRRRAGRQQPGRRAAAVLQPADRVEPGPGRAGTGGRAADRPRRSVQHRRARHPDRRCARGRCRRRPTSRRCG